MTWNQLLLNKLNEIKISKKKIYWGQNVYLLQIKASLINTTTSVRIRKIILFLLTDWQSKYFCSLLFLIRIIQFFHQCQCQLEHFSILFRSAHINYEWKMYLLLFVINAKERGGAYILRDYALSIYIKLTMRCRRQIAKIACAYRYSSDYLFLQCHTC